MIERQGNFWDVTGDVHVITTNGVVKNNGSAVMGRGIALQAKQKFDTIDEELGSLLSLFGNHVQDLSEWMWNKKPYHLFSFPVKHHWQEAADIDLIERSLGELFYLTEKFNSVIMVRPGCGNGKLAWSDCPGGVKSLCEIYLKDSKFIIVENN